MKVYDVDDFTPNAPLTSHDFVGQLEFMLHEVVTARSQQLRKNLENNEHHHRNNGVIIITGLENPQ